MKSFRLSQWEEREAHWAQKQSQLEERLRQLTAQKHRILKFEAQKFEVKDDIDSLKRQIKVLQQRNQRLEQQNNQLLKTVQEKENLISRLSIDRQNYDSRQYFTSVTEFAADQSSNEQISDEWSANTIQQPVGKYSDFYNTNGNVLPPGEIFRLQRMVQEGQESYKRMKDLLKEKDLKIASLNQELAKEKNRSEFSTQQSSEQQHSICSELSYWKQRRQSAEEVGSRKIVNELQKELRVLKSKCSELTQEKQEQSFSILKLEKELKKQQDFVKIQAEKNKDLELLLKQQGESKQSSKSYKKLQDKYNKIKQDFKDVKDQNEILSQDLNKKSNMSEKAVQQAVQDLSLLILSKDKQAGVSPQTKEILQSILGENIDSILKNYETKIEDLRDSKKLLRDQLKYEKQARITLLTEYFEILGLLIQSIEDISNGRVDDGCRRLKFQNSYLHEVSANIERQLNDAHQSYQELTKEQFISPNKNCLYNSTESQIQFYDKQLDKLQQENRQLKSQINETNLKPNFDTQIQNENAVQKKKLNEAYQKIAELQMQSFQDDFITYLQCEAVALEDFLAEASESWIDDQLEDDI